MNKPLFIMIAVVVVILGFLLIYSQQREMPAQTAQGHGSSGGYGSSAPAASGYGSSAPAASGYGSPAPAAGGYGSPAPAAGGYGSPAPAAGGYGK